MSRSLICRKPLIANRSLGRGRETPTGRIPPSICQQALAVLPPSSQWFESPRPAAPSNIPWQFADQRPHGALPAWIARRFTALKMRSPVLTTVADFVGSKRVRPVGIGRQVDAAP